MTPSPALLRSCAPPPSIHPTRLLLNFPPHLFFRAHSPVFAGPLKCFNSALFLLSESACMYVCMCVRVYVCAQTQVTPLTNDRDPPPGYDGSQHLKQRSWRMTHWKIVFLCFFFSHHVGRQPWMNQSELHPTPTTQWRETRHSADSAAFTWQCKHECTLHRQTSLSTRNDVALIPRGCKTHGLQVFC